MDGMNEVGQFALSALAAVISGYLLFVIKSNHARVLKDISQLGLQISCEADERRSAIAIEAQERLRSINTESDVRRAKDEELGRDIGSIRERMAYDRGQSGRPYREAD
jgi:hypothetical protein